MLMPTTSARLALLAMLAATACTPRSGTAPLATGDYDVIIEHGRIVDGTGAAWFYGDLGIKGDRIVAVTREGRLRDAHATERVDARGHVVAPGFIDIQGQSVGQFLAGDGRVVGKITQGVTTEILGEGDTPAPMSAKSLSDMDPTDTASLKFARRYLGARSFDQYLRDMEAHGMSTNAGSFIGAGTLRQYGMAQSQGPAGPAELAAMTAAAAQGMRDGAFGIASALIYPPGNYANTAELIAIGQAVAPYGGVYITHMRSEADQFLESIDEAIQIGRQGGVPVEIYHLKAAGQRNWGKLRQAIAKIDAARASGQDVGADMYPYIAGATGLTACLPPWTAADGKLFDNLADPQVRARIKAEIQSDKTDWENMGQLAGSGGILIVGLDKPENKQYVGKRLSQIAEMRQQDWMDAAMDLILSERRRVETVYFMMNEENVKLQLRQPWMKIGTDSGGLNPETAKDLAHPRAYGSFPRILGKYVRDESVLPLEEAVRKMTSAVARRLSIQDRGLLQEGLYADIAVFDPKTVLDRATYEQPHQLSVGVRYVFVNGVAVVRDGKHTDALAGRIVRGPGFTPAQ